MRDETNRILKLAIVGMCWPFAAWAAQPPNILLIVAEDLSPRIGALGDPMAQTPALDALAEQGVRYDHVYTAPVPVPQGVVSEAKAIRYGFAPSAVTTYP